MKHKFLITILISFLLVGGTSIVTTINTAQPVQAVSKHSWHWHWVKVTKPRKYYKQGFQLYKMKLHYLGTVPRGSELKIRYFSNDHNYQIKGLGKGYIIIPGSSTKWFKNEN